MGPRGSNAGQTRDRSKTNRLAVPHIAETNAILEALKNGTWQERSDTDIRCLAEEFIEAEWPRAKRDYTRWIASTFLNMDDYDPREADKVDHEMMVISLDAIGDLTARLVGFLKARTMSIAMEDRDFQQLRDEAMGHCPSL